MTIDRTCDRLRHETAAALSLIQVDAGRRLSFFPRAQGDPDTQRTARTLGREAREGHTFPLVLPPFTCRLHGHGPAGTKQPLQAGHFLQPVHR